MENGLTVTNRVVSVVWPTYSGDTFPPLLWPALTPAVTITHF